MQTEPAENSEQRAKPRSIDSNQAQELKRLLRETGLVNELKNELFTEWLASEPMHWPEVRAKLALLSTAELVINRMAAADG